MRRIEMKIVLRGRENVCRENECRDESGSRLRGWCGWKGLVLK